MDGASASAAAAAAIDPTNAESVRAAVSEYYGKDLGGTADLKTSACMLDGEMTAETARLLRNVPPEVLDRFYGCGSPIPPLLTGLHVLDLGCGTGRDTFVVAQLVGEGGRATGVDMTAEQLEVAQEAEARAARNFGFGRPNTFFVEGDIANLKRAGIASGSVDVVISNCVLNLASNKEAVLAEVARVLKPGGELYFSDVYASRRVPEHLQQDKVLWGECLSGALYRGDFARIMRRVGLSPFWVVTSRALSIDDPDIARRTKGITFYSETVRAFKVAPAAGPLELEEAVGEDYGQAAVYDGSIPGFPHAFSLGLGTAPFITGQKTPVDAGTAMALAASRYARAFRVTAKKDHRGPFGAPSWGGDCCCL